MNANEAREHLEMVDRILTQAERPRAFRPYGAVLVVVGLAAALLQGGAQLGTDGHGWAIVYAGAALMLVGYAYLVWSGIAARRNAERIPLSEARIGKASSAVWLAVFIACFAQPHIFANWASAGIWNLGGAVQMLTLGFFGDRRSLIGGLLLAASLPAANAVSKPGYVLAAGFVAGYVIPGVLKMLDRGECDVCG